MLDASHMLHWMETVGLEGVGCLSSNGIIVDGDNCYPFSLLFLFPSAFHIPLQPCSTGDVMGWTMFINF